MVARLGPTQILHRHATHTLLSCTPTKSWFELVRSICSLYSLPDPLLVLQNPSTKFAWKNLCKSRVIDWWEQHLRGQAALLPSLQLFKSAFMSLTTPHPIWTTANSPYEISKAVISARMLSGRYRTDYLSRHWSKRNPSGHCTPGVSILQVAPIHFPSRPQYSSPLATRILALKGQKPLKRSILCIFRPYLDD